MSIYYLIYLACCGASGLIPVAKDTDWPTLCQMALEQRVSALVYLALQKTRCGCPDDVYSRFESTALGQMLRNDMKQEKVKRLLSQMYDEDIQVSVMKGTSIGECYADPLSRVSSDVDLLVKPSDRKKAFECLSKKLQCVDKDIGGGHYGIFVDPVIHAVELHDRFEEKESVKALFDGCTMIFENVRFLDCRDHYEIDYTQHFNFICYHILKHFLHGGISIQMLIDVVMFYQRHKDSIDIDSIKNELTRMGCLQFFDTVNGLFEYCGIDTGLSFGKAEKGIIEDLVEDIIKGKGNKIAEGSDYKIRKIQNNQNTKTLKKEIRRYKTAIKTFFFPHPIKLRAMGGNYVSAYCQYVVSCFKGHYDWKNSDVDVDELKRREKLLTELGLL